MAVKNALPALALAGLYGLGMALLTACAAFVHFVAWHFFQDIEGPRGNAPATPLEFTILAAALAIPGFVIVRSAGRSMRHRVDVTSGAVLGFGIFLLVDAATAGAWATGVQVTRYQSFAVGFVAMALTMTWSGWRGIRALPGVLPPAAPAATAAEGAVARIGPVSGRPSPRTGRRTHRPGKAGQDPPFR